MARPSSSSSNQTNKVHEDVQQYIRSKRIDALVSTLLEEVIKYRPNYVVTFIIHYMFQNHTEDANIAMFNPDVLALTKNLEGKIHSIDYQVRGYMPEVNGDIQADLDRYLAKHAVQPLFTTLVERLIISESNNPYATIIENLCRDFPDQALKALEIVNPKKSPTKAIHAKNVLNMMQSVGDPDDKSANGDALGGDGDSDDDDDDYEDDDVADLAAKSKAAPAAGAAGRRRVSVSAESLDPSRVKEMIAQVAVVPKDADTQRRLALLVNKSPMLKRMLEPEERILIVKAFAGPISKAQGADIIRQGEPGDLFYLLEKGSVDVYVQKPASEPAKVASYQEGDTFGQLALLYNAPRAATCKAATDCVLWTLDRISFKAIILGATIRKRDQYTDFLNRVPILSTMNAMEKMALADALSEEKFEDGSIICHEGDAGDNFYIIVDGHAECLQVQPGGSTKVVGRLSSGQYFGEIALLTSKPRQATVRAKGPLKTVWLDRNTFTRVFGPLEEVLKRNMEEYRKYSTE